MQLSASAACDLTGHTLLVIDMQQAWLASPRHEREAVLARIGDAAAALRARGGQVVYIRHANDEAPAGSPGFQLHGALQVLPQDQLLDKRACDSFADTALLRTLRETGTHTVWISGLATEFCVDTTLRAALSHGLDVRALSDAHTTGDREHLSAAQIVQHHNWVWTHLAAPAGRRLQVLTTAEALAPSE